MKVSGSRMRKSPLLAWLCYLNDLILQGTNIFCNEDYMGISLSVVFLGGA